MQCEYCGRALKPDDWQCPGCGAPVDHEKEKTKQEEVEQNQQTINNGQNRSSSQGPNYNNYYAQYGKFDYRYPDINMIMQMLLRGFRIGECRAVMHQRVAGTSMHSGIWKPFAYMVLMSLSTMAAIIRNTK